MCPKRASSVPLCINWACFCRCILRCNAQALGQVHSENRVTKSTTENSKSEFQRAPPGKQNQIRAFESRVSALLRPIASKTCLGIAQQLSTISIHSSGDAWRNLRPLAGFCQPVGLGEQGSFLRQPSLPGVWKKSHDIFRLLGGIHPFARTQPTRKPELQ